MFDGPQLLMAAILAVVVGIPVIIGLLGWLVLRKSRRTARPTDQAAQPRT